MNLEQVRRHRQDAGSTLGFMESLDDSAIVHWGHEPLAVSR